MAQAVANAAHTIRQLSDAAILVVEDDSVMRRMVVRLLQDLAVGRVMEAADGAEALDLIAGGADGTPDVILCDLEMPRLDGLELLAALRAGGSSCASVPVIMMTAHREPDLVNRAVRHGVAGYLVKPVSQVELVKRLSFALQKRD